MSTNSNSYMKAYYKANKHRWASSQKEHKKVIALMGGKCVRCGFSDIRALQIDHVNGEGHKDNNRRKISGARLYRKMFEEIALGSQDYQLLCANCNWIKRYENNEHSYRINEDETS